MPAFLDKFMRKLSHKGSSKSTGAQDKDNDKAADPKASSPKPRARSPYPESTSSDKHKPRSNEQPEQRFTTLPHPAKSNDPADLQQPTQGFGAGVATMPGPAIPSSDIVESLSQEPVATRQELKARSKELNE